MLAFGIFTMGLGLMVAGVVIILRDEKQTKRQRVPVEIRARGRK